MVLTLFVVTTDRRDLTKTRTRSVPLDSLVVELNAAFFPQDSDVTGKIAEIAISRRNRTVFCIPRVWDVSFPDGLLLPQHAPTEIRSGQHLEYRDYNITFNFQEHPDTRRMQGTGEVDLSGRLDVLVPAPNQPTQRAPDSMNLGWPSIFEVRGIDLHRVNTDRPLWLPRLPPWYPGANGIPWPPAAVMKIRLIRQRITGISITTTTVACYPYAERWFFNHLINCLPQWMEPPITAIIFVILEQYQRVDLLNNIVKAAAAGLKNVRIDMQIPDPHFFYENFSSINLSSLCVNNISGPSLTAVVVRLLEESPRLKKLAVSGEATLVEEIIYNAGVNCARLRYLGLALAANVGDTEVLYRIISMDFPNLRSLIIMTPNHPPPDEIRAILFAHRFTLRSFDLYLPEQASPHVCSSQCEERNYIPPGMLTLREVGLHNVRCAGPTVASIIQNQYAVALTLAFNDEEVDDMSLANFIRPGEDHRIKKIRIRGLRNVRPLTNTPALFHGVSSLEINPVRHEDIPAVLSLARTGCTELSLSLRMTPQEIYRKLLQFDICELDGAGLLDHLFTGHRWDGPGDPDATSLAHLVELKKLVIHVTDDANKGWVVPAIGVCVLRNGLQHLPNLRYFSCNKVDPELLVNLQTWKELQDGFDFSCSRFVS